LSYVQLIGDFPLVIVAISRDRRLELNGFKTVSEIQPAPYNPRKITDEQSQILKRSMEKYGDLSGIVVNLRTSHLVGGHQRIKQLDPSWKITKHPLSDKVGTVATGYVETPFPF